MTACCLDRNQGLPPRSVSSLPDLRALEVMESEGNNERIKTYVRDAILFQMREKSSDCENDYICSPKSVIDIGRNSLGRGNMFDDMQHFLPSFSTRLRRRKSCLKKTRINSRQNYSRVSFDSKLSVRYYDICLGDNPSCSYGIPISLGWKYEEDKVDLKNRLLRRNVQRLSYQDRRKLLQSAGYGYQEMRSTLMEIKRVQRSRVMTEFLIPLDNMVDNVLGGVKNFFLQNN
mmetsp:Transcript_17424/g.25735  ORF Transcript_17424/g.25735 Transcript_17424/m.25735 type:complete len:231 (+) Transcript_17424:137-829(+)